MDVYGKALKDYYHGHPGGKLWLHNNYGKPEDMPVDVFFREEDDLSDLESYALSLCRGKVLDVGAGVGVHSLLLEKVGFEVSSLEISAAACNIMKERGLKKVIQGDIFDEQMRYDTILLMMNGIGLCGDIAGLHRLLAHFKAILSKDGQIVFDSSDISYLYSADTLPTENYFGEISYQYEYQGEMGDWFKWLYIDFPMIEFISSSQGYKCQLLYEDGQDQYLARLTIR